VRWLLNSLVITLRPLSGGKADFPSGTLP
jgi:hypothetical protein